MTHTSVTQHLLHVETAGIEDYILPLILKAFGILLQKTLPQSPESLFHIH